MGRPDFIQEDLQRYLDVSPQGVHAAARATLLPGKRVVLHVVPEPVAPQAEKP